MTSIVSPSVASVAVPRRRRSVSRVLPGGGPYLALLPVVVVLAAAVVDVIFQDPETGPLGIYGPLVALAGLAIVCWKKIRATSPLFLAVFVCSYLNYVLGVTARLSIGRLPVNIVDIAVLVALVAELFRSRVPVEWDETSQRTALTILIVMAVLLPAFVTGVAINGPYEAFRDFRPFLFIAIAFFLTRRHIASTAVSQFLLHTMILAGMYSMAMAVLSRAQRLPAAERYLDLRVIGYATPTLDFAFVMAVAFVICGQSIFRGRWAMRAFFVLAIAAGVFSFSLTWYTMLLIVPALCVFFAPVRQSRKLAIVLIAAAVGFVAVSVATLVSSRLANELLGIVNQVVSQYGNLSSSVHVESRFATWTAALALVPGIRLVTGVGMGTHVFFDTGIPEIGVVVAGEPTYGNYLIASGLIGVAALLWLQTRLVRVSLSRIRASATGYQKAIRLGLVVYGLTIVINSFIHNNFMTPQLSFLFGVLLAIGSRGDNAQQTARV